MHIILTSFPANHPQVLQVRLISLDMPRAYFSEVIICNLTTSTASVVVVVVVYDFGYGCLMAAAGAGFGDESGQMHGRCTAIARRGTCSARTAGDVVIVIIDNLGTLRSVAVIVVIDDLWCWSLARALARGLGNDDDRSRGLRTAVIVIVIVYDASTTLVFIVIVVCMTSTAPVVIIICGGHVGSGTVDTYSLGTIWTALALSVATFNDIFADF